MTAQLTCRFYKTKLPENDEVVMVNVQEIEEIGVYVNLLEYNNHRGMILSSELSRRRIRSVHRLVRLGRNEIVTVIRVDDEKEYLDLSKRRVKPEDIGRCEEKFVRGKTVNLILRQTAEQLKITDNEQFEELYDKTAWFYDEKYKRTGAAYDVFARAVTDENELRDCPIDANTKTVLLTNIRRRLTPQSVKCRTDIEVVCYGYEGVDAIGAALKEGLILSRELTPVKINLIAPPLYVVSTTCFDRRAGLSVLENVNKTIKQAIERYQGGFNVKMEPQVVTDIHDEALRRAMLAAEDDNIEKPGDDSDESNEDGESNGTSHNKNDDETDDNGDHDSC